MDCEIESAVMSVEENHGYLATAIGDSSMQVFLTVERCVLGSPNKLVSIIVTLIGVYFAFNIAYPRPLYPTLIFLQHFVLDIQRIPDTVKRSLVHFCIFVLCVHLYLCI